jgi:hypothetical protein
LLTALGLAPAAVYGSSAGATFALCLLIRNPEVVRSAVLHEPALVRLFDDPGARGAATAVVREGMEAGGPPVALERLFCWVAGDANWERLEPALRERMRATAETFFGVELGSYEGFLPDDETLAAIAVPVMVLVSEQTHAVYGQAAGRLAQRLGVEVTHTPVPTWPTTITHTSSRRPSGRSFASSVGPRSPSTPAGGLILMVAGRLVGGSGSTGPALDVGIATPTSAPGGRGRRWAGRPVPQTGAEFVAGQPDQSRW